MIVRYFLYFIILLSEVSVVTLLIKHNSKKERVLAWSIIVFVAGFIISPIMQNTYFFYDQYKITVSEERNPEATNDQVYLHTFSESNREMNRMKVTDGHWIDDGEYLVYDKNYYGVTKEIVIDVPVGMDRGMVFATSSSCGIVSISAKNSAFYQTADLYSEEIGSNEISLPTSSNKYLYMDRIFRVLFFCIALGMVEVIAYYAVVKTAMCKVEISTKTRYVGLLGIGFMVLFLVYGWPPVDELYSNYSNVYYFENYELGFLSRGFIGQVLCEISPYWSEIELYIFKLVLATILALIVCLSTSNVLIRHFDAKAAYLIIFFVLFTPITGVIFTDRLRADICFLSIYLLAVVIINKNRYLLSYLPLLCALIILINETTCITIIPSILTLIWYKYVMTEDKAYSLSLILSLVVSVGITIVTAVYGKGGNVSLEETFANISSHYGGMLAQPALNAEYYELSDHLSLAYRKYLEYWNEYLAFILVVLPILYLIGCFYMAAYRKIVSQSPKNIKIAFGLLVVMAFSPLSAMLIAVDFGRYSLIIFIILMANFFTIIERENVIMAVTDFYLFNIPKEKEHLAPFVIIILLAKLNPFHPVAADSVPYISSWIEYFKSIF